MLFFFTYRHELRQNEENESGSQFHVSELRIVVTEHKCHIIDPNYGCFFFILLITTTRFRRKATEPHGEMILAEVNWDNVCQKQLVTNLVELRQISLNKHIQSNF